jgi:hypothetical protein
MRDTSPVEREDTFSLDVQTVPFGFDLDLRYAFFRL